MKAFLNKNKVAIIFIAAVIILVGALSFVIYKTSNVKEPEYIIVDNNLKAYSGSDTEIVIEESIVTIGESVFDGKVKITKVSFKGNNFKIIGQKAFRGCSGLYDIVLPQSLETICANAFADCSSLETLVIPEGVTSIEDGAFANCANLKSISLPSTLVTLGDNVFKGCKSLETITSKTANYVVENGVLYNADKTVLIKYLPSNKATYYQVPDTVKEIAEYAFAGNETLVDVTIGLNVEKIGFGIFEKCTSLNEVSVPFVGATEKDLRLFTYFFNGYLNNVKNVNVLGGKIIRESAFKNWSNIEKIVLPESLTHINNEAFNGCRKLGYINIPSSVKYVGAYALKNVNAGIMIEVFNSESITSRWETTWNSDGREVIYTE